MWILAASSDSVLLGIPIAAIIGFLGTIFKLLWDALQGEREKNWQLNHEAIERAEKTAVLLNRVNELLPLLLERTPTVEQRERLLNTVDEMIDVLHEHGRTPEVRRQTGRK